MSCDYCGNSSHSKSFCFLQIKNTMNSASKGSTSTDSTIRITKDITVNPSKVFHVEFSLSGPDCKEKLMLNDLVWKFCTELPSDIPAETSKALPPSPVLSIKDGYDRSSTPSTPSRFNSLFDKHLEKDLDASPIIKRAEVVYHEDLNTPDLTDTSFDSTDAKTAPRICFFFNIGRCNRNCQTGHVCVACGGAHPWVKCEVDVSTLELCHEFNFKPKSKANDCGDESCSKLHVCSGCLMLGHTLVSCEKIPEKYKTALVGDATSFAKVACQNFNVGVECVSKKNGKKCGFPHLCSFPVLIKSADKPNGQELKPCGGRHARHEHHRAIFEFCPSWNNHGICKKFAETGECALWHVCANCRSSAHTAMACDKSKEELNPVCDFYNENRCTRNAMLCHGRHVCSQCQKPGHLKNQCF